MQTQVATGGPLGASSSEVARSNAIYVPWSTPKCMCGMHAVVRGGAPEDAQHQARLPKPEQRLRVLPVPLTDRVLAARLVAVCGCRSVL